MPAKSRASHTAASKDAAAAIPARAQKLQKGNAGYKKVRTFQRREEPYNGTYRGQNGPLNTEMEVEMTALSNLFGWNRQVEAAPAAACGTACGAADKPAETPSACGAADKPAETPSACGSACGAGDL